MIYKPIWSFNSFYGSGNDRITMIISDSSLLCVYDMLERVIAVNCLTQFINFILVYRDPRLQRYVTGKIFSGTHIHYHEINPLTAKFKC